MKFLCTRCNRQFDTVGACREHEKACGKHKVYKIEYLIWHDMFHVEPLPPGHKKVELNRPRMSANDVVYMYANTDEVSTERKHKMFMYAGALLEESLEGAVDHLRQAERNVDYYKKLVDLIHTQLKSLENKEVDNA